MSAKKTKMQGGLYKVIALKEIQERSCRHIQYVKAPFWVVHVNVARSVNKPNKEGLDTLVVFAEALGFGAGLVYLIARVWSETRPCVPG